MFKGLLFSLLLAFVPCITFAEALPVVGDDDFPPFSFVDENNEVTGIDIDIINELANRLGLEFSISLVPWKRLLRMTKQGDVFGSFSLFRTPEREAYGLYTYPVHYSTYRIFTRSDGIQKFEILSDLFGKNLGIEAGFNISEEFDSAAARGNIKLVELYSSDGFLGRLKRGGIDGYVGHDLVTRFKFKQDMEEQNIVVLRKPVKEARGAFFVMSKAFKIEDKMKLRMDIERTLQGMENDGTTEKIIASYIDP